MKKTTLGIACTAIAITSIQTSAAIGFAMGPGLSWHEAYVSDGADMRDQNYTISGDWADPADVVFSNSSAHSEVSLTGTSDSAVFRHENLTVAIGDDGADYALSQSLFKFTLTETVSYILSGNFAGSIAQVASSGDVMSRIYATLSQDSVGKELFEYESLAYNAAGSFAHQIDGVIPAGVYDSQLQGSVTGTLAAGSYSLNTYINLHGEGDASGAGWFQLDLATVNSPASADTPVSVPDASATFVLLGLGLAGLSIARRRIAKS